VDAGAAGWGTGTAPEGGEVRASGCEGTGRG